MKQILQKILFVLPGLFAVAMVSMSALTYNYINSLPTPAGDDDKDNYESSRTYAIVNLALAAVIFVIVALAYVKTMKPQSHYITYF
jgi:hypothetical protein